jgi:myo-inositol 2-dehydrogenase/D-chiro-inositol 1-dehydrogenase
VVGILRTRAEHELPIIDTTFVTSFDKVSELLAAEPDVIIVGSEIAERAELIQAAVGKVGTILCEPPFADSVEGTQAIIATCDEHGTHLQPAFELRYLPTLQTVKQTLDDNRLGQLLSVKAVYQVKRSYLDKGVVSVLGTHLFDLLRWLLQSECAEIFAEIGSLPLDGHSFRGLGAILSAQFANGAYALVDLLHSTDRHIDNVLKLEFIGTKGELQVDAFHQSAQLKRDDSRRIYWGTNPTRALLREFIACVREGRSLPETVDDVARAEQIVLAARESAKRQQAVAVR